MNDTIVIEGSVSQADHGVAYNGSIKVVVGNVIYGDVKVVDGKFNVTVSIKDFKAGSYDVTISEVSGNDNYTFKESAFEFKDNVTVDKAEVIVEFDGAVVTYGDYEVISIKGRVSNSTYGVPYSGKVNVTIGGRQYPDVDVVDGVFTVGVSDIADYNAGKYDVSIVMQVSMM